VPHEEVLHVTEELILIVNDPRVGVEDRVDSHELSLELSVFQLKDDDKLVNELSGSLSGSLSGHWR
jgi:hypothetical protein